MAGEGTSNTTTAENIDHCRYAGVSSEMAGDGTDRTTTAENIDHRLYCVVRSGLTGDGTGSSSTRAENTDCKLSETLPVIL